MPDAYELYIAALLEAEQNDEACTQADAGLAHKYPSRGLKLYAANAYAACGKKDKAAGLRKSLEK